MNTMDLIERSVRRRVQFAVSGILLAVLAVGMLVLHPEYSRAAAAGAEIARLQRESGSIGATESRLAALEAELERRTRIEAEHMREIPVGADEAGLADALALSVDDGGANSWSVRMLDPEPVDSSSESLDWMSLPAVIDMQGRFGAVIEALRRVEASDRLVRVRMLRVSRPRNVGDDRGVIDASVELDTVFVMEEGQ